MALDAFALDYVAVVVVGNAALRQMLLVLDRRVVVVFLERAFRKVGGWMQASKGRRRGSVFSVRMTSDERRQIESLMGEGGPRSIGPWLLWSAARAGSTSAAVVPAQAGTTPAPGPALPGQAGQYPAGAVVPRRRVLDLCGGSGAWSRPYAAAGYDVQIITLPDHDVRVYVPPANVHGVLAAPPCTEFSLAKNGADRDFAAGLETVVACLRVIALARPVWWALENPVGHLGRWLGTPRDVFEPCDFGDPWTKRTALWGDFSIPVRRFVRPASGMPGRSSAERAITPSGFATAFFNANP